MEIRRTFFVDSISTSNVQLRRWPTLSSMDDTCSGRQVHQANLVLGVTAATTAEAGSNAFWKADCTRYELIIRRLT